MKVTKNTKIILLILLALTVLAAGIYLVTRRQVPDNALAVEYGGKTHYAYLEEIRLTEIHGERVNGKGETKSVDGMGFHLSDLISWTLGKDVGLTSVTVTASDGVSAEITRDELEEEGKVMLLYEESGTLHLIVFGDENSKRSVKQVETITVK